LESIALGVTALTWKPLVYPSWPRSWQTAAVRKLKQSSMLSLRLFYIWPVVSM
jgi:hypothetical protein